MAWLGVPFRFLSENSDSINLAVNSLPNLVLKSDPDYTSAVITAVVSLVAGIIPAGIAMFTFYRNAKIIKDERVEQQSFLKTEREEQQRFLKEERAAHTASMEADRETQKEIAERNFNIQVLSVNRQAWINKLRDLMAEYMSAGPDFLTAQFNFINHKKYFQLVSDKKLECLNQNINSEAIDKSYSDASEKLQQSINILTEYRIKEKLLTSKIKLMLNPEEKWYPMLVDIFGRVSTIYNSFDVLDEDIYFAKIQEMNQQMEQCLNCSQELLKYEWNRVKKGE